MQASPVLMNTPFHMANTHNRYIKCLCNQLQPRHRRENQLRALRVENDNK